MTFARSALAAGSLAGLLAVLLGAFGAHALRGVLDASALAIWHTAVEYQFWHALALLAVGILARERTTRALRVAATAFVIGVVSFCGSLYALAIGAPSATGALTPLGGIAMIVGWGALIVYAFRRDPR